MRTMLQSEEQTLEDIYRPRPATVVRVEDMTRTEKLFELELDSGEPLGHMPGQFVEVSLAGIGEAPISVSSSPTRGRRFELVVRRVGSLTRALHHLKPGDKVGIRGPFGTWFPVDTDLRGRDVIFICGGIGLVPVRSAIQYVVDNRTDYGHVFILFGARTPADRLFTDEYEQWCSPGEVTFLETVDKRDARWTGAEGVITTLIPCIRFDPARTVAVICGPPVMYRFVIVGLKERGMAEENIFVSLERRMKCGVGKCGHCQINHIYVCQKGPVFRLSEITDLEEAL